MIQSMKPASTSGTRHDMPNPAGVNAPESDRPIVTLSASIFCVNSRHASRRRPALYERNASSTIVVKEASAVNAGGSMRLWLILCKYLLFGAGFFMQTGYGGITNRQLKYKLASLRAWPGGVQ